ncbi:MAG: amino acid permease [Planctomycetota bacterium]
MIVKPTQPQRNLTLFDATCIIVGTIVGAGIFQSAPTVASAAGDATSLIILWLFGGVLTLAGALCFAELTTRFMNEYGGDYAYLKMAFGKSVGFMFAWATFWIIRPGNIGAMALTFAIYLGNLLSVGEPGSNGMQALYAVLAVVLLSVVNLLGLKKSKWLQNVLTVTKVVGILLIAGLGIFSNSDLSSTPLTSEIAPERDWLLALVFVMFSFGGWNDLSFISNEIVDPKRNLLRALILGSVAVTAVYVVINIAFVIGLGFGAFSQSKAVATDLVTNVLGSESLIGQRASKIIASLVCISCLGAINGIIITSPRIYYAAGRDFQLIGALGVWNQERDQPWLATMIQAVVTVGLLCLCFGYEKPFDTIVIASAPFFWGFLGLTGVSLIVFRRKNMTSNEEQPSFRVPFYPLEPLLLIIACFSMAYSSTDFLIRNGYWLAGLTVLALMVVGILLGLNLRSTLEGQPLNKSMEN